MTDVLPRWDLTPFFPSLADPAVRSAVEQAAADVATLVGLFDEHDVRGGADRRTVDGVAIESFEAVVAALEAARERLRLVSAYLAGHVDTDAADDLAAALQAELQAVSSPLRALAPRFDAWVASFGADALIAASPAAAALAWPLRKAEVSSRHQLSEAEEALAAELWLSGGSAWMKLHGDVSARLTAVVELPGGAERLPITVVRNLAGDPDPVVRRAAYDAEVEAWRSVEVPLAAALNGVKGEVSVLNRRRGWPDDLAPALHLNAVDRPTFDALTGAVRAALPDFRRYLRAKAALLGHRDLPWWDLLAPVGDPAAATATWEKACATVEQAFATYSPSLQALARRAFAESWIDAEPHDGKRGGAYCMAFRGGESRVFMNFAGTADSVTTLAHELGHAYHNSTLAERGQLQRQTPMALAETASIFCETVLVDAWLDGADDQRRLVVLDTDLTGSTQVVVDIHSRLLFESRLFERRARRPLAPAELCALMVEAQQEAYGDAIDRSTLHPYMWAVKPHYYSSSFYNWPYTFGLLFGLGLYARFQDDPERFRAGYDDLLSSTGLAPAAELALRFGIDVRDEEFWSSSLAVCRDRIDAFCALRGD